MRFDLSSLDDCITSTASKVYSHASIHQMVLQLLSGSKRLTTERTVFYCAGYCLCTATVFPHFSTILVFEYLFAVVTIEFCIIELLHGESIDILA